MRKAIQFDDDGQDHRGASENVTYQSLVASHVSQDALDAVEWMEEAEEALLGAVILLSVCMHSMIASTLWQTRKSVQTIMYPQKPSRASRTLSTCTAVVSQTASTLPPHQPTSSLAIPSKPYPNTHLQLQASLERSPTKCAMKGKTHEQELTPFKPAQKRAVIFSQSIPDDMDDDASFPATPTKKRRIDSPAKVTARAGTATSPRKRTTRATDEDTAMAAFHAAITGQASHVSSPSRPPQPVPSLPRLLNTHTTPDDADLSTPRRPRTLRLSTSAMNVGSPTKSSVAATPTRSALQASASARPRRRYYPVFLDQQQWLARDQRVERIWADAATHCPKMVELYGHPLERYRPALA